MELTITEKKENVLVGSTDIRGTITFDAATPSNADVAANVTKQLHADPTLLVVKHIYTQFGQKNAKFHVIIYKNAPARKNGEVITQHLRKKIAEKQKAGA